VLGILVLAPTGRQYAIAANSLPPTTGLDSLSQNLSVLTLSLSQRVQLDVFSSDAFCRTVS
jgi:hypothetical protein